MHRSGFSLFSVVIAKCWDLGILQNEEIYLPRDPGNAKALCQHLRVLVRVICLHHNVANNKIASVCERESSLGETGSRRPPSFPLRHVSQHAHMRKLPAHQFVRVTFKLLHKLQKKCFISFKFLSLLLIQSLLLFFFYLYQCLPNFIFCHGMKKI